MPKTSAATAASLTAAGSTPLTGPSLRNQSHVTVNLTFENVTFSPVALHIAGGVGAILTARSGS